MVVEARADPVNPRYPVRNLDRKEGGHLREVSSSSGVQLGLEARPPASRLWILGKGHTESILS